jgi:hypothetical protein
MVAASRDVPGRMVSDARATLDQAAATASSISV